MFKRIGSKIKALAKIVCWLKIIWSLVLGGAMIWAGIQMGTQMQGVDLNQFLYMTMGAQIPFPLSVTAVSDGLKIAGVVNIVLGCLFAWTGSFMSYGFGELVETSSIRTALLIKRETER